jgi:hypothetical protein
VAGHQGKAAADDDDLACTDCAGGVHHLGHLADRIAQDSIWPLASWIAAAMALLPLGVLTPRPFELDHGTGQITRPGSVFPLIRNLVVFGLQYTVAVISAVDVSDRLLATIVGRAISGATAGYFIGSTIALLRAYWRKRQADLTTSPPPP